MERSTKRGPRNDDTLKKDFDSVPPQGQNEERDEYFRREGMTDAELVSEEVPLDADDDLDPEEVQARSDLSRFLRPSEFPTDRDALIGTAKEEGAPDQVLSWLNQLPADKTFETPQEIWEELGGDVEDSESRA